MDLFQKLLFFQREFKKQAFVKLHNLSLRTPEKLNAMEYTVDLIKYAAHSLDNGIVTLNQTFNKGFEAGATLIKEAPREVKDKVRNVTHDALAALSTAAEVISKQIPTEISTKFNQIKEVTITKGDGTVHFFSQVAQSSSNLLHEMSSNIGTYVSSGEKNSSTNSFICLQKITPST